MAVKPSVMVVLPTYNERENLPQMVAALFALEIPNLQILVVDDNSPDGTGALAEELRQQYDEQVHVMHRTEKAGLGPAYLAGFRKALNMGAEVIIQMDADFSHQPKYIPQLLDKLQEADLVIGSRFAAGGSVDPSWGMYRKLLSWWANRIYTPLILGLPVRDATAGFKAWKRATLYGMDIERVQSNGYVFQVEMNTVAHKLGYKIAEVPIYFPDRQRGESKMDSSVAIEAALRVWQLLWRYRSLNQTARLEEEASASI
ncbi:MAG: polyprenol monophosphomannose synthase [Anaerolineae bacterium]|nr:polyprenol monophosphomannose synthase [Anaerolineae bacterium]